MMECGDGKCGWTEKLSHRERERDDESRERGQQIKIHSNPDA